ncbi:hypothetical protein CR513_62985, partial [Mucuna pruriens]
MSAATKGWIVAFSIGAVEALKDQLGVCRWNYALRSLQQHAKNNIRSYSQATQLCSKSSAAVPNKVKRTKEESMTKVMEFNCWACGFALTFNLPLVNHPHIYRGLNKAHTTSQQLTTNIQIHSAKAITIKMSAATRAWIVASSIGAVEALKDQLGVCRWNYALRSLQQHAKNNIRSYTQAKSLSSATSAVVSNKNKRTKEDSMRKVMDLSCWGPNTA